MAQPPVIPWQPDRSRVLTLWHGCLQADADNIMNTGIDLNHSRIDLDFGRGFYTTTVRRQSVAWADRRWVDKGRPKDNPPKLLRFRVPRADLARLENLSFVAAHFDAGDYWSFVAHCRSASQTPRDHDKPGWYDTVSGPLAADWRARLAHPHSDQFSFHTQAAIELLKLENASIEEP